MEGGLPLVCCLLDGLSYALFLWKGSFRMGFDRKAKVLVAGLGTAENVLLPGSSISRAIILILMSAVAVSLGTLEVAVGFWTSFL